MSSHESEEVENTNRARRGRNNNLDMQALMVEMRRMMREEMGAVNERIDTIQESVNQEISFGLLKRREPEKVQRSLRPHQESSFGLLKKREPEKVQRRSQESPLRRVHPRQGRDEEGLDYYSRGSRASDQSRRRPREEEATYYCPRGDKSSQGNERRLRKIREEHHVSKPKLITKSNTAAKGKAMVSTSKARDKGEIKPVRVKGKAETATSRTREVRCFKSQGRGQHANECTNKKTMVLLENHEKKPCTKTIEKASALKEEEAHETKEAKEVIELVEAEVVFDSLPSLEEHVEMLVKGDLLVTSSLSEEAIAKEQEQIIQLECITHEEAVGICTGFTCLISIKQPSDNSIA